VKEYRDKEGRPYVQVTVRITGQEAIDLLQAIRFADTGRIPSASAACRGIVMEAISAAAEVPAIAALAASFAAARARREAAPPTWPAPGGRGHLRLAASDGKRR
jgi:hypothetical protein